MSWRSLVISRPSRVSIKNNQLVIEQEEAVSMPIEDIASIVIESPQVVITVKALDLLSNNGTIIYICNDKHTPSSYFLPFYQHSRQYGVIKQQLSVTEPFKKRIWQQIIRQKIKNQAYVLQCIGKRDEAERIAIFEEQVDSGDTKNIEGYVAKMYFEIAFGKGFNRNNENIFNACLDYGYSILRGAIARIIAKYGFIPSIGIHHKSELNNYNLADDFIEPFRPIVDMWVIQKIHDKAHKNHEASA